MASFGEILARFKASEEAENIIALIEDEDLRRGIVAWKSVRITFKPSGDCPYKEEVAMWEWLWENVEYDAVMFGVVAGARGQDVAKLLQRLIGLRLIYPDGTINHLAKNYLQAQIMGKLNQAQGRRKSVEKSSEKQA